MAITKQELKQDINLLLKILDKEKLNNLYELKKAIGRRFLISSEQAIEDKSYVQVSLNPSNLNTYALTVSYITPGKGIPIEFWINKKLDQGKIILKSEYEIGRGYIEFFRDPIGNKMQIRSDLPPQIPHIKAELESIVDNLD